MLHFSKVCLLILTIAVGCASSHRRHEQTYTFPKKEESLARKPYKMVVIDPGHGGEDFGTHSHLKPRYQEKFLNLTTARFLKNYLTELGYQTIMTRNDDTFIPLLTRASFANAQPSALFISVHFNSAPSKEARGIEIYFYEKDKNKKRVDQSKRLAELVLKSVISQTKAKSRGVKHGNFAVIRETTMPAILVEGGFLTNDEEIQKIKNPEYLKKLALGMAKGIDSYLRLPAAPKLSKGSKKA
ncbi:MAG: N-acetylmuramoyl-L-alanine amidase family protein [Parachlamydiaceae bacterium]